MNFRGAHFCEERLRLVYTFFHKKLNIFEFFSYFLIAFGHVCGHVCGHVRGHVRENFRDMFMDTYADTFERIPWTRSWTYS